MIPKTSLMICIVMFVINVFSESEIEKKSWPRMKSFDIWNTVVKFPMSVGYLNLGDFQEKKNDSNSILASRKAMEQKRSRVFHLFPVPVDGECLSDDGRRIGTCFNVYECRLKGGIAKGDCSMGFGVCCIFVATCDQVISSNITYLVSPNFPSSMPNNITSCKVNVKMIDSNISQLRIDFNHFSLGQPNRRTGICDGDAFNISGGPLGVFSICGQNGGQHIYYEVGVPTSGRQVSVGKIRQSTLNSKETMTNSSLNKNGTIEIAMRLTNRFLPSRFWEIRIAQIPFSQRAPAGCLQYLTGTEGIVQTFNFADNGRHLANQHYKSCIRQETNMCSIMYQPCDDQSFRIGPTMRAQVPSDMITTDFLPAETLQDTQISTTSPVSPSENILPNVSSDSLTSDTTTPTFNLADVEGSGEDNIQLQASTSRRPIRGGFDILSFFRSAFNFKRHARTSRQFFTTCSDRITMPCIIEDFVGAGMGPLPGCEPVHCGNQFCATGIKPCRIESTVTPFYLGINFGDGVGKGSAEDNIGACIRYTQMQCI